MARYRRFDTSRAGVATVPEAIESVRSRRAGLRNAISSLESALAAPAPHRVDEWRQGVRDALTALHDVWTRHIVETEAPGAFLDELVDEAPRLSTPAARLRREHNEILGVLNRAEKALSQVLLDDESSLYDSRVIVEYLDKVSPNNRLIPATGRERITVKRWEALGDGIGDAAATALLESRRPDAERSDSWIERQREKMRAGLQAMSDDLGEKPWCHGNSFSLADIAVGSALGYLLFRHPDIDWRNRHHNLGKLYDKLMQRPSFAETVPHD